MIIAITVNDEKIDMTLRYALVRIHCFLKK